VIASDINFLYVLLVLNLSCMWIINVLMNSIMPPRLRPLCDINQGANHHENGDGELPPPPPSPSFQEGIHPTFAQLMVDTTRHFTEAVVQISQTIDRGERRLLIA
jgi:hypothetical protein